MDGVSKPLIPRWQRDKEKADLFLPEIEKVIRKNAGRIISVRASEPEKDIHQAVDYVVRVEAGDIACRIRAKCYWDRFGDITLRSSRRSGVETELDKIRHGFCKWYLYAWGVEEKPGRTPQFHAWVLFDLDMVRQSDILNRRHREIMNVDGSSSFVSITLEELAQIHSIIDLGGAAKEVTKWG